jgi:hypothetical protein
VPPGGGVEGHKGGRVVDPQVAHVGRRCLLRVQQVGEGGTRGAGRGLKAAQAETVEGRDREVSAQRAFALLGVEVAAVEERDGAGEREGRLGALGEKHLGGVEAGQLGRGPGLVELRGGELASGDVDVGEADLTPRPPLRQRRGGGGTGTERGRKGGEVVAGG